MHPYREPGVVPELVGADDNPASYLEERILDRYMARRMSGDKGYAVVRANSYDFTSMARRLGAKTELDANGYLLVKLHTAAGIAVVIADPDVPGDRYRFEMHVHVKKFAAGDVVKLKSSTTLMTVDGYDDADNVKCMWFEGGTLARALFNEVVLEKCERPS